MNFKVKIEGNFNTASSIPLTVDEVKNMICGMDFKDLDMLTISREGKDDTKLCVLETVKKYSQDELLSIRAKRNDEEFIKRYPNGRYTIDIYQRFESYTLARTMNRQNCRVMVRRYGELTVHMSHEGLDKSRPIRFSVNHYGHNAGLHSFDNLEDMLKQAKRSRVPKALIEIFLKELKTAKVVRTS